MADDEAATSSATDDGRRFRRQECQRLAMAGDLACRQYQWIQRTQRFNSTHPETAGATRFSNASASAFLPTTKLKFSDSSFRNSSPCLWNSMPPNVRSFLQLPPSTTINFQSLTPLPFSPFSLSRNQFLSCLKTHLSLLSPFVVRHLSHHFQLVSSVHRNTSEHPRIHQYPSFCGGYIKRFIFLLYSFFIYQYHTQSSRTIPLHPTPS